MWRGLVRSFKARASKRRERKRVDRYRVRIYGLGKTRKRAYRSAVVILNVAIDLIATHFMYHVVFPFIASKVVHLRRNISRAVLAI